MLKKELVPYDKSYELYGRKCKKVRTFEKATHRIGLTHATKMHVFRVKHFSKALKKFSTHRITIFKILGRSSKTISLLSQKNIKVIRPVDQKILTKQKPIHFGKEFKHSSLDTIVTF